MKSFFHTTLLLAIIFFTFSCKTKQDQVMKEHYNTVNKYSALENKLLRDNKDLLLNTSASKNNNNNYDNSVDLQMYQSQVNTNEYKVLYDDSEIVNGDVYKEAAAHRQKLINDCNCGKTKVAAADTTPISLTPSTKSTPSNESVQTDSSPAQQASAVERNQPPVIFAHLFDAEKKTIRRVRVELMNKNDQDRLKQYSVVIAAFSKPESVERLKKTLGASGNHIFFVQNELGIYYAIIDSYNTEREASQKIRRVYMEYTNIYTAEQLINKYGISFTNLWILKTNKNEN